MSRLASIEEELTREAMRCLRCGVPLIYPSFCLTCQMNLRLAETIKNINDQIDKMVNELFLAKNEQEQE